MGLCSQAQDNKKDQKDRKIFLRDHSYGVSVSVEESATTDLKSLEAIRWVKVKRYRRIVEDVWKPLFDEVLSAGKVLVACNSGECKNGGGSYCFHVLHAVEGNITTDCHAETLTESHNPRADGIGARWSKAEDELCKANGEICCFDSDIDRLLKAEMSSSSAVKCGCVVCLSVNGRDYLYMAVDPERNKYRRLAWPENDLVRITV